MRHYGCPFGAADQGTLVMVVTETLDWVVVVTPSRTEASFSYSSRPLTAAAGIWSGMIGGTLMQTVILIWTAYKTDWNKEVR
ncbi:hypothetical protein RJ639_027896 [Escallonia herrerae]|uniref:Uncharacterized protein n=1 Tax=Escallonia herrerae TaxID=1293975 RepID=A0AA88X7C3_9ASTE|nr:hypothetical protein RJ639_027896 [Escallonia herrerae]